MKRYRKLMRLSATLVEILFACLFPACSEENKVEPPAWPDARNLHAAAHIPSTNEILIFGGTASAGETNTLWSFKDGKSKLLAKDGPRTARITFTHLRRTVKIDRDVWWRQRRHVA